MDRVFASLKTWANITKNKKVRDKGSNPNYRKASSFQNLPNELLEGIFQYLSEQDILQCRRVCSFLRKSADEFYTRHLQLILNDGIYRRRPAQPLNFDFYKLAVQRMIIWKIPVYFIQQNFFSLAELDFSDCISTKNFQRILENTPNLQILRMNSIALGGSKQLQPYSSRDLEALEQRSEQSLTIREIHLTLDYVPSYYRGFSCQLLVANLLAIQNWNTPELQTISFTVEPSCLQEQFYFGLDTFLTSVPVASYKSLTTLTINSPKLQPPSSTPLLSHPDLLTIQLKNIILQIPNSTSRSFSVTFSDFLRAQRNIQSLLIVMKEGGGRELESTLRKQNDILKFL